MKPLRYLSLCSGIEAASVAWRPLGWEAPPGPLVEAALKLLAARAPVTVAQCPLQACPQFQ